MPLEIERKFLVVGEPWREAARTRTRFSQGYLNRDKHRTVRVRVAGAQGFLTIKGATQGASRVEFEYEIPVDEAEALLALCDGPVIQKVRHVIEHAGHAWEVDVFEGDNAGLVVAEIELADEAQAFVRPPWLGAEVTHDARYFNSNLAAHPYRAWAGAAGA